MSAKINHERGQYRWEGWGAGMGQPKGYPTVDTYKRYNWGEIEPTPGVYNFKIIHDDIARAKAESGMFAFRVMNLNFSAAQTKGVLPSYIENDSRTWDFQSDGKTWRVPDWNSELYVSSWERFSVALAKEFDGNPTVSYIDLSGIGHYGEGHDHPYSTGYPGTQGQVSITEANAKRVLSAQINAFKRTRLTYNLTTFLYSADGRFLQDRSDRLLLWALEQAPTMGLRYDCIGGGQSKNGAWLLMDRAQAIAEKEGVSYHNQPANRWETAPFVSEWCANIIPLADVPSGSVTHGTIAQGLQQVRERHISMVSSHNYGRSWQGDMASFYSKAEVADFVAAADEAGYRYHARLVKRGSRVGIRWANTGTAPIYRETAVTYTVGGRQITGATDLRRILPGKSYIEDLPDDVTGPISLSVISEVLGEIHLDFSGGIILPRERKPFELTGAKDSMPTGTREPKAESGLLFDADFPNHGMERYQRNNIADVNPAVYGEDWGVCSDPAGSGQIVGWCDSFAGKTNTNKHPRSQAITRRFVKPALASEPYGTYARYIRLYVDPVSAMPTTAEWLTVAEYHGPPFIGSSPMCFMMVKNTKSPTGYTFRFGNKKDNSDETIGVPVGKWFQILILCRYAEAKDGGWCDFYFCPDGEINSPNWVRVKVQDGFRKPYDVVSDIEGNAYVKDKTKGPSYASWGAYGSSRGLVYCSHDRIGVLASDVMPSGWSGRVAGRNPDEA